MPDFNKTLLGKYTNNTEKIRKILSRKIVELEQNITRKLKQIIAEML